MKKYFAVIKILFKAQLIYRFDVAMTAVSTIGRVLFAWILWGAMFTGREQIGNFTFQSMLMYYVVASFLASIDISGGVSGEVSSRIRGGTFSKFMVIPANPQLHFLSQNFGASGYYAIFATLAAVACALIFQVNMTFRADIATVFCAVTMVIVGMTFMVSYQFFIGILTFKFQDSGFFQHIQGSVIAFLTGAIIPLSLLPQAFLSALNFLPFTYITYMPTMLLTGQESLQNGMFGLAVLACWTAAMMLVSQVTYNRLRVRYDGVGI